MSLHPNIVCLEEAVLPGNNDLTRKQLVRGKTLKTEQTVEHVSTLSRSSSICKLHSIGSNEKWLDERQMRGPSLFRSSGMSLRAA